jgi:hypothetical protein
MEIRHKPLGSWFGVVLRSPEFSIGRMAVMGGIGGTSTFPKPDFGTRCVCCNRRNVATRAFDAGDDRKRVAPIPVPLCGDCETHVTLNTLAPQIMGAGLCVGVGLALLPTTTALPIWFAVAGLGLIALIVLWMLLRRSDRRRSAAKGHYTGLQILCLAHQCSVVTNNPRLVKDLLEHNRERVFRTTQPSESG